MNELLDQVDDACSIFSLKGVCRLGFPVARDKS